MDGDVLEGGFMDVVMRTAAIQSSCRSVEGESTTASRTRTISRPRAASVKVVGLEALDGGRSVGENQIAHAQGSDVTYGLCSFNVLLSRPSKSCPITCQPS